MIYPRMKYTRLLWMLFFLLSPIPAQAPKIYTYVGRIETDSVFQNAVPKETKTQIRFRQFTDEITKRFFPFKRTSSPPFLR